ncbi:MAG: Flp family type IVb pilin [Candidatus Firestonebacteria bacterium]
MKKIIRSKGQTIVEYALIVGLVAVLILGVMKIFNVSITAAFGRITTKIAGAF